MLSNNRKGTDMAMETVIIIILVIIAFLVGAKFYEIVHDLVKGLVGEL